MKIIEIHAGFLPKTGGVETHMYGLCKRLIEKGNEPIVLTWGSSRPFFEIVSKTKVHRFWMPRLFSLTRYAEIFYLSLWIIYFGRKYHVNLIHAHNYLWGLASVIAGRFLRKPIVVTIHDPMWYWPHLAPPAFVSPIEPILKKYFVKFVSVIICNSKFTCRELLRLGFPRSKLRVIYNWVPLFQKHEMSHSNDFLKKFHLHKKSFVLSVGRLDKLKGFSMLINAFRLLVNKGRDLDLVIVGEGPDKGRLMKQALKLGLKNHVHLLGRVSHMELACLYEACELFVLPSRFEGLGLVLLEAMSFGKPIVSTRVGGVPEVIEDGRNGILVDLKPGSLASGIERLLLDSDLKEVFAKRSQEVLSEKFSVNNCYATVDLLEKISRAAF